MSLHVPTLQVKPRYWKIQACYSTCVPMADFPRTWGNQQSGRVFIFSAVLQMKKSWCALLCATLADDGDCKTAVCIVMSQDVCFWCCLFSFHSNWFLWRVLLWFSVVILMFSMECVRDALKFPGCWCATYSSDRLSFLSTCLGNANLFWVQEQKTKRRNGFSSLDDGKKPNRRCFRDQRAFVSAQSALSAHLSAASDPFITHNPSLPFWLSIAVWPRLRSSAQKTDLSISGFSFLLMVFPDWNSSLKDELT